MDFASVVDALRSATRWEGRAQHIGAEHHIEFRIGIQQGDIVVKGGDISAMGECRGRPRRLGRPAGICISARVQEDAAGRLDLTFNVMGDRASRTLPGL